MIGFGAVVVCCYLRHFLTMCLAESAQFELDSHLMPHTRKPEALSERFLPTRRRFACE